MKKTIVALVTLVALFVGFTGVTAVTAAPAQAAVGSSVWYISKASTVNSDFRVVMTQTSGRVHRMVPGNNFTNSFKICPSNLSGKLKVRNPAGGIITHPYGACVTTSALGQWSVTAVG